MSPNFDQNQIYSFFTPTKLDSSEFTFLNFTSEDDYNVFVVGNLSSSLIVDLRSFLTIGVGELKVQFNALDMPILERMKTAIYKSGDFLVEELSTSGQPLKDVDYSVGIFAFKRGYLYVWIDGSINARVYRGNESILINAEFDPQFFGSMEAVLGDVYCLSLTEYVKNIDDKYEDYVLENQVPEYPSLYIDYQVEDNDEDNPILPIPFTPLDDGRDETDNEATKIQFTDPTVGNNNVSEHADPHAREPDSPEINVLAHSANPTTLKIPKINIENVKVHVQKFLAFTFRMIGKVYSIFMRYSSVLLDKIFLKLLKKNSHQLKRFQSSPAKKQIQHLLLVIVCSVSIYFLFSGIVLNSSPNNKSNSSGTQNTSGNSARTQIQGEYDRLVLSYNTLEIDNFNAQYSNLKKITNDAKQKGTIESDFADKILSQAQSYDDKLNKVSAINKVDGIYRVPKDDITLIDFDVIGNDVYAIDSKNSQILRSSANQDLEVVVKSAEYANLKRISCATTLCYLLDEEKGLLQFDIASKKISAFRGLTSAGIGVQEMVIAFENIYTLVPGDSKLMRYTKLDAGFRAPIAWNSDGGFGVEAVDFAVDGNVFEMNTTGILKKYFNGKLDASFKGLEPVSPQLGSSLQLALTPARQDGRNRVYIADGINKRIVVYQKDQNANGTFSYLGSYKYRGSTQIKYENFEEIVLSKDEKFLFILENNMIFKVAVTEI